MQISKPRIAHTLSKRYAICDVPVDSVTVDQLIKAMIQWSQPGSDSRYICYVNAHVHNLARRSHKLREILRASSICYPDGAGVVWASRLWGVDVSTRVTGADFLPQLVHELHRRGRRIYFLGGKPGVAQKTAEALAARIHGFQPAGMAHGYFRSADIGQVIDAVRSSKPDLLIVGMGTPQQEHFVAEYLNALSVPLTWVVGALFDYQAGEERRCPVWMGNLGLEWMFRLCMNPRRMAGRYILGNPRFVAAVLSHRLRRD